MHYTIQYLDIYRVPQGNWYPFQGSKEIRQWLINWCTLYQMIQKSTLQYIKTSGWNLWTFSLMNQPNSIKVPKVVKSTNKNFYCKTLRTSVITATLINHSLLNVQRVINFYTISVNRFLRDKAMALNWLTPSTN